MGLNGDLMRAFVHPSVTEITVEGILHALADPERVSIYASIVNSECPQSCSSFLRVSERAIPKSTLSQHFKALREAGLIRSERKGVEVHNTSRCAEIEERFPGLIRAIVNAHSIQLQEERRRAAARKRRRGGGVGS